MAERMAMGLEAGLSVAEAGRLAGLATLDGRRPVLAEARAGVRTVLVAVDVVTELGAPAADVLRRASAGVRDGVAAERSRRAAVAGPVAAARIVASLPLAGPLLAVALGIDPVAVLLGTAWGRACGACGIALLVLSAWWARRLVAAAREASTR